MLLKQSIATPKAARGISFSKALLFSSLSLFAIAPAFADIIAKWNQNDAGYIEPEAPVWAHHPNAVVSKFTMHGSVERGQTATGLSYGGWKTVTNETDYVGFTVTPQAGETLVLTSLNFFFNPYMNPEGFTYKCAYRLDEGSGFGPWVYASTIDEINIASQVWNFPAPLTVTGTIEFGFFIAIPATSYNVASPGGPILNGTAGTYVPPATAPGVISQYTEAIGYKLSVGEASAITYNWDTDTLFSIGDEGPGIQEVSKTGKDISYMGLRQNKFPVTNLKGDPEGLAYLGNSSFLIGAERMNLGTAVTYTPNGYVDWISMTPTIVFGVGNSNTGLEGVALDRADGSIWGVQERQPITMYRATGVGSPTPNVGLIDLNDLKWRFAIDSISDLYAMGNSAAFPGSDHVLVLARDNALIIEMTKTGQVVDVLDISGLNSFSIEGLTVDNNGVVYLCAEGGFSEGGSILFVLTPPHLNRIAGTGGRQTILGTAGDDEIYGNPASDVLTGGEGSDVFVFKTLRDGPDTITDFTPGQDFIDLTQMLKSLNYTATAFGYRPFVDLVKFVASADGAVLQLKSGTSYRTLATFRGRTVAEMNVEDNFRFRTANLAPQP